MLNADHEEEEILLAKDHGSIIANLHTLKFIKFPNFTAIKRLILSALKFPEITDRPNSFGNLT